MLERYDEGHCDIEVGSLHAQFGKLEGGRGWGFGPLLWRCTVAVWPDVARLGGRATALRNLEVRDYGSDGIIGSSDTHGLRIPWGSRVRRL